MVNAYTLEIPLIEAVNTLLDFNYVVFHQVLSGPNGVRP